MQNTKETDSKRNKGINKIIIKKQRYMNGNTPGFSICFLIKGIPSANWQILFLSIYKRFLGRIGKVCCMNQIQCASIDYWVMGQLKSDIQSTFIQYSWTGQRLKNGPKIALLLSEDL